MRVSVGDTAAGPGNAGETCGTWAALDSDRRIPCGVGWTRGLTGRAAERFCPEEFIPRGGVCQGRWEPVRSRGQRRGTPHIWAWSVTHVRGSCLPFPLSPLRRERPNKESCHLRATFSLFLRLAFHLPSASRRVTVAESHSAFDFWWNPHWKDVRNGSAKQTDQVFRVRGRWCVKISHSSDHASLSPPLNLEVFLKFSPRGPRQLT